MSFPTVLGVRFNMRATVLNEYASATPGESIPNPEEAIKTGHFEVVQDEETGGIKKVWVPDVAVATPVKRDRGTSWQNSLNQFEIECYVRGLPEVGFRSSANNENFLDGVYKPFEAIQMVFPAKYVLNRRQLITNIRGRNDMVLWLEEETGQPTVFEVQGVTPTFDPFGKHIDNLTVLKRSEIQ